MTRLLNSAYLWILVYLLIGNHSVINHPAIARREAAGLTLPVERDIPLQRGNMALLSEDFEDSQAQGWNYNQSNWQIFSDPETGSRVWTTIPATATYASTNSTHWWSDYRFELHARRVNSDANLYFRISGINSYALRLESNHIALWTERSSLPEDLISTSINIGADWHEYAISAIGKQITVTVDGVVRLSYNDSGPASLAGGIGLESYAYHGVFFDNIQVVSLLPEQDQPDPWVQTNGPMGGMINTIEINLNEPDTLFAGGMGDGIYKTTNGGAQWTLLPQFVNPIAQISDILLHPANSQVIYVLAGKLYKSADGGQSWTSLVDNQWLSCVAMDPTNASRLLAGTQEGRVFFSSNAGTSWVDVTSNLPGYFIKGIDFGKGNELWVGTGIIGGVGNGLLYHSVDGGASWSAMNLPGQALDSEIHTIFVDRQNRDILYVGLSDIYNTAFDPQSDVYMYKTTNGGINWEVLRLPGTDSNINIMGRASYDSSLYVATGGQIYRSGDGGQNWTWITPSGRNGDMYDIAVDPRDSRVLFLPRRAYGIVKSTDQGASWLPINAGLLNTTVSLIALGDTPGSTIYAATTSGEGTYKSSDYGNTWENVTAGGITHPWSDELVVTPTDPHTIWEVADVGEVFVSNDSGSTWTKHINPYGAGFRAGTIQSVANAPSNSSVIYAVKSGFGIFKSLNSGGSWDFLHQSEVDYTYSLAVNPTNPNIVFSGYNPKPFQDWAMARRSTDGGLNWSTVLSVTHSSGITSMAIDPQNPNTVYAGSTGPATGGGGQIFRSLNSGDTWTSLNPHFTMLTVWGQPQLIGNPTDPSTAYAATWLAGTWKTTNAGQTWTLLNKAPQSSTALSLDPASPNVIYSADRTAPKVWKSTNAGVTWVLIADFSSSGAFMVNRVFVAGNAVYASTFGPAIHSGILYRSNNGGSSWTNITNGLPRSVLDVSTHPTNPQVIYVTTHIHGAYKSTDGGTTWTELAGFPNIGGYDIEVDPINPNIVYAGGLGSVTVPDWVMPGGYTFTDPSGVYKSTDGGGTWQRILTTSNECRAIRLHPSNHNLLFAAALSDGFFVSTDAGLTWSNHIDGLDTVNLTSMWVAGDKVYAGTQGFGVYAGTLNTSNGAVTWDASRSNKPVPDVHNIQIQIDPANSNRIYVGANPGGLFRSDDGGQTWFDKNFLTPSVVVDDPKRQGYYTFAINPSNPDEVWVGTWGKGLYKSNDGQDFNVGANGADNFMYGKFVNALTFHQTLGVLAATEQGVFQTTNGGNTWIDFSTGLDTLQVRALVVDAHGSLYAGTAGYELYFRVPSDSKWQQVNAFGKFGTFWPIWNNRPLYQYSTLLFHPTDANIIYFGTFPAGIFKSQDGGESWREYNVGWLNDGVFTLDFHPQNTDTVYAGTYNGLNRSRDGGAHWERWDNDWPSEQWVFSIAFDPRDPKVMYACSKNGENEGTGAPGFHGTVMKSTDGGAHWSAITTGLDVDQEFYKIIIDKFDPDMLYLATQREGVFISYDGGAHWQPWNAGLTNLIAGTNGNNVTNSMTLSDNGLYLYFGSAGSGIYRRMTLLLDKNVFLPLISKSAP